MRAPLAERAAIAFFGVRGIGSVYYLAYAVNRERFAEAELLWAIVLAVIMLSILVHGITAPLTMRTLEGKA
jgi:NhaP-type Na+/H+ or K+/H+ antiporter